MPKCIYCGEQTKGHKIYCSTTCQVAVNARKRGEQFVQQIMANPRKVLDTIPIKHREDLPKLEEIRQKIEQKYFLAQERLPSTVLIRLEPEESKIVNYIVKTLDVPKENVFMIGLLALYITVRELHTEQDSQIIPTSETTQEVQPPEIQATLAGEQELQSG